MVSNTDTQVKTNGTKYMDTTQYGKKMIGDIAHRNIQDCIWIYKGYKEFYIL